ncbi:hypothetical protein [Kaistia nematophila]|uniref:Uncharacterized protein n=1 Tax=Kaistia nematophila TaxID=2994654 RepID=A0A9X3IN15_9HYPH|nr:hypothetical protein [Kaistia nematophila]MCX5571487.1 hypothetical protein [Kaistia nematophila]
MSYTILSATFANPEHTAAIMQTEEAGAVLVSKPDRPGVWAAILAWGEPEPFEPPPAPPPSEISRRQFFHALAMPDYGLISEAEALAAVQTGAIPAAFEAFITTLPSGQQFSARMLLAGAATFEFEHPISITFGAVQGWSDEQRANLWRFAAGL